MPSVYDFRHVELDKVGRGKRVIQAPGGNGSGIFSHMAVSNGINGSEASDLNSIDSGSLSSLPTTPVNGTNGTNGSANGHFFGDAMSECSTPPSSASSSRRGSRQEDTKNRLFGPETESPRRRVVDRMKSNIFTENSNGTSGLQRSASVKKYDHVIRRNPITGEVFEETDRRPSNGHSNGVNGKSNGVNGSASLPTTPVRVRQPPGGKCSGIFN